MTSRSRVDLELCSGGEGGGHHRCWGPVGEFKSLSGASASEIAKLVQITPRIWFMNVSDPQIYRIHGVWKPIYNWGAAHCMNLSKKRIHDDIK